MKTAEPDPKPDPYKDMRIRPVPPTIIPHTRWKDHPLNLARELREERKRQREMDE